ncbi:MAG: 50S ribosomal protein L25 [bacterium]|nr:50S ribosomal protein L25 [bacterium]
MLTLKVKKRLKTGKGLRALRRAGDVPAVVYGAHTKSTPIVLSERDFEKIFKEAGEATIVSLVGLGEDLPTLIHDVDLDPLTDKPRHVDFYAVTKGQKVEVKIPIEFIGEAPAAKAGANVVKILHEIEIEADPMDLPKEFVADLSVLVNIGDQIHVRDLQIPPGIELKTSADEVIALVQEVVEEAIEEAPVDLNAAIEVEKKGKEEGGEGVAAPETKKEEKK